MAEFLVHKLGGTGMPIQTVAALMVSVLVLVGAILGGFAWLISFVKDEVNTLRTNDLHHIYEELKAIKAFLWKE